MQKILYFTRDFSAENQALAAQHHFVMRNANAYHDGDFIEQCDAVYGDVPQAYLDRFPLFELPKTDDEKSDLTKLKTDEIKVLLKEKGIAFDDRAKKDVLIKLLQESKQEPKE